MLVVYFPLIPVSSVGTVSLVEMQKYADTNLDLKDDVKQWLTSVLQLGVGAPIYEVQLPLLWAVLVAHCQALCVCMLLLMSTAEVDGWVSGRVKGGASGWVGGCLVSCISSLMLAFALSFIDTCRCFDYGARHGVHAGKQHGLSAGIWDPEQMELSASDVDNYLLRYVDSVQALDLKDSLFCYVM